MGEYQQKELSIKNDMSGIMFPGVKSTLKSVDFKGQILVHGERFDISVWENKGRDSGRLYYTVLLRPFGKREEPKEAEDDF